MGKLPIKLPIGVSSELVEPSILADNTIGLQPGAEQALADIERSCCSRTRQKPAALRAAPKINLR